MRRIRVLVVDDSVVIRKLVSDVLSSAPDIEVVGTAVNGRTALVKVEQFRPDVVTLDIEMPEMDGIEALRALRVTHRRLPVIMFSTLTERGASATLEALAAGASDYVTKPANVGSIAEALASVREQLLPRIRALTGNAPVPGPRLAAPVRTDAQVRPAATAPNHRSGPAKVLAIGCSTGGPQALGSMLQALPASLPVPVVVVQHMPPVFTAQFAARLDRTCALTVHEAAGGEELRPGNVYLAPGNFHMELVSNGGVVRTRLNQGPQVSYCRPAVDVLFASVANVYREATVAVVLTGMGSDGRDGCAAIRRIGGHIIVQDEATSVVWGMPGSVATAGLAHEVVSLPNLAASVQRALSSPAMARTPGASLTGMSAGNR